MTTPFVEKPPRSLPPTISRFDPQGKPTRQQLDYEGRLEQYLIRLVAGLGTMQAKTDASALPTANPHVVGQVWSNAGILTVSAG